MLDERTGRVLKNEETLTPNYLPADLIGREGAVETIVRCLGPARDLRKPVHVWLHGPSGSGKTAAARLAVETTRQRSPILTARVSAWRQRTFYSVLDALTTAFRILRAEEQRTAARLHRLEKHLGQDPCLIILDDLDLPVRREREDMIHSLAAIGNVGLICVSASDQALLELDRRVRARLNPRVLPFRPYTSTEIVRILEDRARKALVPGAWNGHALDQIAKLASGSATLALEILRAAAKAAEADRRTRITAADIRTARSRCLADYDENVAATLTPHHRALWRLVRRARTIRSDLLRKTYLARCRASRIQPVAPRTYSKYLSTLIRSGLIQSVGRDSGSRVFGSGSQAGGQSPSRSS